MEKVCTDSKANIAERDRIKRECGLTKDRKPIDAPAEHMAVNDPEYLRRPVGKKSKDWYSL
jgi:hypothetical protein